MHTDILPTNFGKPKPIVAVTMGDAAGVGPELCLRLLAEKSLHGTAVPLVIGDSDVLTRVSKALKIPLTALKLNQPPLSLDRPAVYDPAGALPGKAVQPGVNQAICGRAAARYIEEAVTGCSQGWYVAMVTAPISKKALNMGGVDFPGHTEMLAHLTHAPNYAMLLYSSEIACAFATCHQSLRSVPDSLTPDRIADVANLAFNAVTTLRGHDAKLCMLGLNPHAGEEGLFGDEEIRILAPAKNKILERGIAIDGPLPPDTAFTPQARTRYDCYISMYHDQGSIPFKMLAFDTGVNITMGLPIVRTSPDHGTAFDIAWQGKVRPDSFFAAYSMAVRLASNYFPGPRAII
ncbi:MAG TPA: 4-hydroxythreonine-4-phosphate dehydrogenase PdxA [Planctomycetota bacterium]|nr:4-hydroxythreonine-4-phosphate dehydrogenase PdxA [Planctomycetota bacterium]